MLDIQGKVSEKKTLNKCKRLFLFFKKYFRQRDLPSSYICYVGSTDTFIIHAFISQQE